MRSSQHPQENAILQKVENALEQAVLELGLEWYNPRIKRQKYTYLAVDHFTRPDEYPVTYSWFKWGASFPAAPAAEDGFGGSHTMYSPEARNTDIFSVGDEELINFFKHDIETIPLEKYWNTHHLEFLIPFYEEHAPPDYRQMYLANIEIRKKFQKTTEEISDGKQPVNDEMYEEIGQAAANLQMGIMTNDELGQVLRPITKYTDLMEDVFLTLPNRNASDIDQNHLQALIELKSTYTETIWALPTNIVSQQTAVGPNKNRVHRWAESGLETALNQYPDAIQSAYSACDDAGLLPDLSSYPEHDDEAESIIEEVVGTTDGLHE